MARIILTGEGPDTARQFQTIAANFEKKHLIFAQQQLRKGAIDGRTYAASLRTKTCGCLFGVLALSISGQENLISDAIDAYADDGYSMQQLNLACELSKRHNNRDDDSDVETFVGYIRPGDKPKNSRYALKLDRWLTKAITGKSV